MARIVFIRDDDTINSELKEDTLKLLHKLEEINSKRNLKFRAVFYKSWVHVEPDI